MGWRRIAARHDPGAGPLSYLLADHLGSTVGMIDALGNVATQKYWPFGGARTTSGPLGTDKQYTGQQKEVGDAALGLYNYTARFYSTVLGRFASADPIVGRPYNPQSWNPYTYVRNNPMRLVDPTGLDPVCFITCTGSGNDVSVDNGKCPSVARLSSSRRRTPRRLG